MLFKDDKTKVVKKWKGERKNFVSSMALDFNKAALMKNLSGFLQEVVKTTKV